MIVVRRTTAREFSRVQMDMEDVFRALIPSRRPVASGRCGPWRPALEVYETEEALVVTAEIAGLAEDELRVTVAGDVLAIRGERPDVHLAERRSYHEARIPYGAFAAEVFIPFPVDVERAEAEFHNGFLRIVLPRTAARTIVPRRVDAGDERGKGA